MTRDAEVARRSQRLPRNAAAPPPSAAARRSPAPASRASPASARRASPARPASPAVSTVGRERRRLVRERQRAARGAPRPASARGRRQLRQAVSRARAADARRCQSGVAAHPSPARADTLPRAATSPLRARRRRGIGDVSRAAFAAWRRIRFSTSASLPRSPLMAASTVTAIVCAVAESIATAGSSRAGCGQLPDRARRAGGAPSSSDPPSARALAARCG